MIYTLIREIAVEPIKEFFFNKDKLNYPKSINTVLDVCNTVKQGAVHGTATENQVHDSSFDMKSNNMVRTTSDIQISRTFQGFFKDK